ncbi:MAG TPA: PP2C family protein-serine/threonine phosphatase [Bacteroidota bacterium]|nr:PP2C family protein-serine/threonine phosphatase [Bacteroidota bacterium]
MTSNKTRYDTQPALGRTLLEDMRRGDLRQTIRRDYLELKLFILNEEQHKKLKEMNRVKRFLHLSWWLLKSLLLKLTPARRILLAIGLLLLLFQDNVTFGGSDVRVNFNFNVLSALILVFVLMLELKDKLLAREELEAGQAIQKALMPQRSPEVPGWRLWLFTRSANEVGGDLVDFITLSKTKFGVAVGDVAGKGLRAALLTAKLQATMRALVTDFSSLSEFGAKLNQIFNRDSLPNLFASLLYVEFLTDSDTVRFVNAGHIPPVVLRGTTVQKMEKGDAALGLLPAATFSEHTVKMNREDILLTYSDGLTDAQNEFGEFFGEQRLLDLLPQFRGLSTEQIGENLISALDRFVGQAKASDDVSIAILKRL